MLKLFYEGRQSHDQFFLRDGQKWLKQERLNIKNLNWCDYGNGILFSGRITGEPLAYFLSAAGLKGINGRPVTSAPWLAANAILGLSTYEAGFQFLDLQTGTYYSLPKGYEPLRFISLQTIVVREKTGARRYAIYDIEHNKTSFLADNTMFSGADGFYCFFEHEGGTHVYNSKGKHFRWPGHLAINQIRCSPHEIIVVESNAIKEYVNTTINLRRTFKVEDELSIFDTFLKVENVKGETFLIDLVTGENVPTLSI